jgi:integrase
MMKTEKFPVTVSEEGVSATIRKFSRIKNGKTYTSFSAEYFLLGKRKQEWRSKFEDAKTAALEACRTISRGQQVSLQLANGDRLEYLRANEALNPIGVKLDVAAHEYAGAITLLGGRATITEACRDWLKRNAVTLPRVTVFDAVAQLKKQAVTDKKSQRRRVQLAAVLDRLAESFNCEVHTLTPNLFADYLAALPFAERTKANHRDVIGYFNRWLILRGYLPKGTDWLEGVQKYKKRKIGKISTYTADEMLRLIAAADDRILPLIVIGGFAGLRHSEIARLEWQDIDLAEGFIEVKSVEGTKSDETRRIVPIKDNLKKFLLPLAKKNGKVLTHANTTKQLLKTAAQTRDTAKEIVAIEWKHNALRHTYISARVAESGDVPRVADEAGNSPQVIRTNYLKRIRPAAAAEWFAIAPVQPANVLSMPIQKAA